jgi:predicted nucleotidyltransferase
MNKQPDHNYRAFVENKLARHFANDQRVLMAFLTGSSNDDSATPFSDLDLWLILAEESGINAIKREIAAIFQRLFPIKGIYECTAHHYFVVLQSGLQIDLNLATAAQYFSLSNKHYKKIIIDRNRLLTSFQQASREDRETFAKEKLLIGLTTLERGVSKFLKRDYYVCIRFLDSVRNAATLPLLPLIDDIALASMVALDVNDLSPTIKALFEYTFAAPNQASCLRALKAQLHLLQMASQKSQITDFDDIIIKMRIFLK